MCILHSINITLEMGKKKSNIKGNANAEGKKSVIPLSYYSIRTKGKSIANRK